MNRRQRDLLLMIAVVAVVALVFHKVKNMNNKKSIQSEIIIPSEEVEVVVNVKKPSLWQRLKQSFVKSFIKQKFNERSS